MRKALVSSSFRSLVVKVIFPAFSSITAILLAFVAGSLILLATGFDPLSAYLYIFTQPFSSLFGINKTLSDFAPLLIIGSGLFVCFRAGIWNIGATGQLLMGALFANVVGYSLGPLPSLILIPLVLGTGFITGAAWAMPSALLKAKLGVNEVITTLLLNFVAINLIQFLIKGIFRDVTEEHPLTYPILEGARLPYIPGTQIHIGVIVAIGLAFATHFFLYRTTLGFEIRVMGENVRAAKYAGISPNRLIIIAFIISGGAAGLAGAVQVAGVMTNISPAWTPGYGIAAVSLVFLAKSNGVALIPLSMIFATILVGTDMMQRTTGIPMYFGEVVIGLMLLFFAVSEVLQRLRSKLVWYQ